MPEEGIPDADTLLIPASHKSKRSFGCANGRDYTYFGDAYFNQALRRQGNFIEAFAVAKNLVTAKELAEGLEPSQPQMHVGAHIAEKLKSLPPMTAPPEQSVSSH